MKKLLILPLAFGLTACVSTPVINQADLQNVNFAELLEQKSNKSCQSLLFGFIPIQTEASVAKAAWEAGIEKVSYVETSRTYVLPIMSENCVIVYGE